MNPKPHRPHNRRLLSYLTWGGVLLVLLAFILWQPAPSFPAPAPAPTTNLLVLDHSPPKPTATPSRYKLLFDSPLPAATVTKIRPAATQNAKTRPVTVRPTRVRPTATPSFVLHAVKAGETLITIAAAYGIATEALITVNALRDPTVAEGQKLVIPPPEGLPKQVLLHKIAQTDTLLNIAAKYGSSVNDILAVNPNLMPPLLPIGQVVAVPVVFVESRPTPLPQTDEETVYHTVESGDMPLSIAYQYEIPVEMLLAANEITDPTLLQIGQQLVIPPADGVTQGVPIVLYELAEGDTLLHIATEFGSSVKDILAVNPDLNPASLAPGQTIAIPIIFAPIKPTPQPGGPGRPREPVFVEASGPLVDLQQKMITLVNAERTAAGLGPYQADPDLELLAVSHAQDMVKRGYLSHTNPDGATLRDRFAASGIGGFGHVGEDIQRNTKPRGETVETAFNWFMGSRPHRANLLHHYHNRIGVGIVEGPPGWFTFVLVFAER